MVQAPPQLPVDEVIDITASNKAQQRGPHGAFRFFGKLAPDVTGAILELASRYLVTPGRLLDPMAGSGTTLLEATTRGWRSIGVDVNPAAVLFAHCKLTPVDGEALNRHLDSLMTDPYEADADAERAVFGRTRNADRWFSPEAQGEVTRLRVLIDRLPRSSERNLLLASLLASLRRIANASPRTGRLFYDPLSAVPNVRDEFARVTRRAAESVPQVPVAGRVLLADARCLPLSEACVDLVFVHPPYFGLYRFSSDVLRFELEVGGWSRREVASLEVEEGWKSGDPSRLDTHVSDMRDIFDEARRVTVQGGGLALVTSNSTLGDLQLPVVDRLAESCQEAGWSLVRHVERVARHGSASYHRSARVDKVIAQDHVLLFRRTGPRQGRQQR